MIVSPEELQRLLEYDPQTGKLFWKERKPSDFKDGYRSAEGSCNNWNAINAGKEAFTAISDGYRVGAVCRRMVKAHRVAFALMTGCWPQKHVDHINGNRSDNRWCNLRLASPEENGRNSKISKANTSGFRGVCFDKKKSKWMASICHNRKHNFLGYFDTAKEASRTYEAVAKELHGQFYYRINSKEGTTK